MNQSSAVVARSCPACGSDISHRDTRARFCNPACCDKYRSVRDPDRYRRMRANLTPEQRERKAQYKRDNPWKPNEESKERAAQRQRERRSKDPDKARVWGRENYQRIAAQQVANREHRVCANPKCSGTIAKERKLGSVYCSRKCNYYVSGWRYRHNNRAARYASEKARTLAKSATRISGNISPATLASRIAYYGNSCWMCGGEWEQIDHVKPLAKGGPHILANLRPACGPCNASKRDFWPWPARE